MTLHSGVSSPSVIGEWRKETEHAVSFPLLILVANSHEFILRSSLLILFLVPSLISDILDNFLIGHFFYFSTMLTRKLPEFQPITMRFVSKQSVH